MDKKIVILISGKAGTGKSYRAKMIQKLFGTNAGIFSFASNVKNPLNSACIEMFGCNSQDLDPKTKELFRPVLQAYGQVGRAISPEYWVDQQKEQINKRGFLVNIIDDCRFENELKAFDANYEVIKVRLNRTSANENVNQDESETGLDHLDNSHFDIIQTDNIPNSEFLSALIGIMDVRGLLRPGELLPAIEDANEFFKEMK